MQNRRKIVVTAKNKGVPFSFEKIFLIRQTIEYIEDFNQPTDYFIPFQKFVF